MSERISNIEQGILNAEGRFFAALRMTKTMDSRLRGNDKKKRE